MPEKTTAPSEATFAEDKAAAKDPRNVARAKHEKARQDAALALDASRTAKIAALESRIEDMNR